jgi:hypothetical protein
VAVVYSANIYGNSNPSDIGSGATITIMVIPSAPGTPNTTNSGSNVIISWTAPTVGAPFLYYTVMIYCANG